MSINGDTNSNGALDIERGGTNATTAGDARTNLNVYAKNETYTQQQVGDLLGLNIVVAFSSSGDTDVLDPYSLVWTSTVLRVVHTYGIAHLPAYTIIDNSGVEFSPSSVTKVDTNTVDIDFGPIAATGITGTWTLMLSTGGIGKTGSQGITGTLTETNLATVIHAATSKATLIDADEEVVWDSVASGLKKQSFAQKKANLKTYFDTLYSAGSLTTYANLTAMEASTSETDGDLVWCTSLLTQYQRLDAGSAYTRNGTDVCNTGSGGNTRFVAVAGKYVYTEANFRSVIIGTTTVEQSAILDLTDYDVETDEGATYHYIGRAPSGTATSAASWRIARITIATEAVLWADGNRTFDNIWDNRASLSYS